MGYGEDWRADAEDRLIAHHGIAEDRVLPRWAQVWLAEGRAAKKELQALKAAIKTLWKDSS